MFGFIRRTARSGGPATPQLKWDLHAHLLPGVDDGVKTMEDAVEAIRALQALGYRASVLTPHVYHDLYPGNCEAIFAPVLTDLKSALSQAGIEHELKLAAEYFGDEHFLKLVEREPLLSFGSESERFVLVEFPYTSEPLLWADVFSAIIRHGYTPVLAHIERYRFVILDPETWLARFREFGVKLQCNIGSLAGQYGRESFEFARRMRNEQAATFWGTDLHRPKQVASYIVPGLTHLSDLGVLNQKLLASGGM